MPDPFATLGVPEDADDAQVRAAYLNAVRRFPPERCPELFQVISEAHEALRDDVARAKARLFGCLAPSPEAAENLVPDVPPPRGRIGRDRWLAAIAKSCTERDSRPRD